MSGDWRYEARRLNGDGTSTLIDPDLPLGGVSLTTVLSGPSGMQATISPAMSRLKGPDGKPLLQPYSTALYAVQDQTIRCGGIITSTKPQGPNLSLTATGFSAYPAGKIYDGDIFFIQTDPLDIVRHIWGYLQGRPRANLGVVLGQQKVGVLIGTELKQVEFDTVNGPVSFEAGPYKLNWWETDDLGSNITNLAKDYPFDYEESHAYTDSGDVSHLIDFGVPRIGTRRGDLRFVVGENVTEAPSGDDDYDGYASEVYVRGAGEGRTMIRGYAARGGELRIAKPHVVEDKKIKSVTDANKRAREELDRLGGGLVFGDIKVMDIDGQSIGAASNGDEIEIQSDGEWGNHAAFYRIVSTTITPDDLSQATYAVMRADTLTA